MSDQNQDGKASSGGSTPSNPCDKEPGKFKDNVPSGNVESRTAMAELPRKPGPNPFSFGGGK